VIATRVRDEAGLTQFRVDPTASAVLVEARSNVGVVSFGTTELAGSLEVVTDGHQVDTSSACRALLTVPLSGLTSGNALYDAELQQRLAVQRHPNVVVELTRAAPLGGVDHHVAGNVTLHGVTAELEGDVRITQPDPATVLVTGESVIDIRDFEISLPSVLMLRIYPDVSVSLHLVARRSSALDGGF
jgi:polyisoprenoid-binding protein YceI